MIKNRYPGFVIKVTYDILKDEKIPASLGTRDGISLCMILIGAGSHVGAPRGRGEGVG
jgi:hypothetical protein